MNHPNASAFASASPQAFNIAADSQFSRPTLGLGALWAKLSAEKIRILAIAAVVAMMAALYATVLPAKYTASARILIDLQGAQGAPKTSDPDSVGAHAGQSAVESQMQIIVSDGVLNRVVKSENLALDPEFGVHVDLFTMFFGSNSKNKISPERRAFQRLANVVDVSRVPGSFVVDVSVSTGEAQKSARIAQAIATTYVSSEFEAKASLAGKTASSLNLRLEELRSKLKVAEGLVEKYKTDNKLVDTAGRLVNDQQLSQLSRELVAARARAAESRTKFEQIERLKKSGSSLDSLGDAIQSEIITQLRVRLASLRLRQVAREAVLHPNNPELRQMGDQAASLRRQINIELERIAGASESEAVRLQTNVLDLERELQKRAGDSARSNKSMVELRELERDVQAKKAMYDVLLERTRDLGEDKPEGTGNVRIVTPARVPGAPSGLPLPMMLILGFGAGLAAGSMYVLSRPSGPVPQAVQAAPPPFQPPAPQSAQPSAPAPAPSPERPIASGGIAERMQAHTPPPASTPSPAAPPSPVAAPPSMPPGVAGVSLPSLATVSGLSDPTGLYPFVTSEPLSLATAAIGQLSRLLRTTRRRGVPQTVVIGAAGNVEARPGVAMNLALCAANGGDRVLLLDAEFTARPLSTTLANTAVVGLGEVAGGIVTPGDVMIKHPTLTVAFVPAAENRRGPQHVLSESALREHVLSSVSGFDLIVFDAGEFLHNPSSPALGAIAHDIVVVTDPRESSPTDVQNALDLLGLNQTKVRGTLSVV